MNSEDMKQQFHMKRLRVRAEKAKEEVEERLRDKARITELEAEVARLTETLAWYGEQTRLARLIHREGDAGRHALAGDGGARARAALPIAALKDPQP